MRPSDRLSPTGYALADPVGGEYVVYVPHAGKFTVNLSAASDKSLHVLWMDLDTSRISVPTTIKGGSSRQAFASRYRTSALILTPRTVSMRAMDGPGGDRGGAGAAGGRGCQP